MDILVMERECGVAETLLKYLKNGQLVSPSSELGQEILAEASAANEGIQVKTAIKFADNTFLINEQVTIKQVQAKRFKAEDTKKVSEKKLASK